MNNDLKIHQLQPLSYAHKARKILRHICNINMIAVKGMLYIKPEGRAKAVSFSLHVNVKCMLKTYHT